jgi:hypothetical protein
MLVRTQLQAAADSAAMAGAANLGKSYNDIFDLADRFAGYHIAGRKNVELNTSDVEIGIWDSKTRTFTPSGSMGNAVRVKARRDATAGGEVPLFFSRVFKQFSFSMSASAVAMANPRDIAFVVDLSGSMNDDTEPCWATGAINSTFAPDGYPTVGNELMEQVYDDFGYGAYPGVLSYVGEPWGVPKNYYAYANLTRDGGPLTLSSVPAKYRIRSTDNETTRKRKGYSAIIDFQIASVMPNVQPAPNSTTQYAYWEKYLDYIMYPVKIKPPPPPKPPKPKPPKPKPPSPPKPPAPPKPPPPPKPTIGRFSPGFNAPWYAAWQADPRHRLTAVPTTLSGNIELAMVPGGYGNFLLPQLLLGGLPKGTPPVNRGWLPPRQDGDRIHRFNNPNKSTFPSVSYRVPRAFRNKIGYQTYVQFMMDHGRDLRPVRRQYVPLSKHSNDCPWHNEDTAGGTFSFPPRSQPLHAARRALIAAIQVVKERNVGIVDPVQRDWVSIVAFDTLKGGGPVIEQPLTSDYDAAMLACTSLQAVGDKGMTTATEAGMILAKTHIDRPTFGGQGRQSTNKVVVLLTDGVPNAYLSNPSEIADFIRDNPSPDFYDDGRYWCDAPLMQSKEMQERNWFVFPVGIGLGTDYDFMDRMSRMGGTANNDGESPRGSGNPAEYERRLAEIFEQIITSPQVHLVQ